VPQLSLADIVEYVLMEDLDQRINDISDHKGHEDGSPDPPDAFEHMNKPADMGKNQI
jgi:hypothetical protein